MGPALCFGGASEEDWTNSWACSWRLEGWRSEALACSDEVKLDGPGFLIDRGMVLGGSNSREGQDGLKKGAMFPGLPQTKAETLVMISTLTHTRQGRSRHLTVGREETIVGANFPDTSDVERCYLSCRASVRSWDGRRKFSGSRYVFLSTFGPLGDLGPFPDSQAVTSAE